MPTDGQVRKLRRLLSRGDSLALAARKTGMDEKTARKYRDSHGLPSDGEPERDWRTRVDPFVEVWPEVKARAEALSLPTFIPAIEVCLQAWRHGRSC